MYIAILYLSLVRLTAKSEVTPGSLFCYGEGVRRGRGLSAVWVHPAVRLVSHVSGGYTTMRQQPETQLLAASNQLQTVARHEISTVMSTYIHKEMHGHTINDTWTASW